MSFVFTAHGDSPEMRKLLLNSLLGLVKNVNQVKQMFLCYNSKKNLMVII